MITENLTETTICSDISNRIVKVEDLLNIHNISLEEWEITNKVVNSWESSFKDKEGQLQTVPNYQVKVSLRSKNIQQNLEAIRESFKKDLKELSPSTPAYIYDNREQKEKLLEVNIFDLHLGKVAWMEETGENYNIQIACSRFEQALDFLVEKASTNKVDKILFPIGNDFFNSDYSHPFSRTTKGTPQEEDTRWQNTFRIGRKLVIKAINKLSLIAPVDVIMIPGNHDYEKNFYLGDSLEGWFHNNDNVSIDNSPSPRKYYRYGKVLIGFTHGSEEKLTDLPGIMAQEVPYLWGATLYREFHLGHLHQRKSRAFLPTTEVQGTVVRHMSSLSATDAWHHKKGYIGAVKSAEALIWDKELGLESNIYFNLPKILI